jgi:predicted nucleotidyltransferase
VIPTTVRAEIMRRLTKVEEDEGVRILMAIESGSRAWGFPSPDSDFDVRFIYSRPEDWYISVDLEDKRDVLEYEITDDIDLNGWDLRKALRLLARSNPTIVEWLQSPIEYVVRERFRASTLEVLLKIYSMASGIHHYRSMAKTNYRGYLRVDAVPLKKYFYVMRPLLAIRWIETHKAPPPIEFERLLPGLEARPDLLADISTLLEKKKASAEMDVAAPFPRLNQYIEAELDRLEGFSKEPAEKSNKIELVNELFRSLLTGSDEPNSASQPTAVSGRG